MVERVPRRIEIEAHLRAGRVKRLVQNRIVGAFEVACDSLFYFIQIFEQLSLSRPFLLIDFPPSSAELVSLFIRFPISVVKIVVEAFDRVKGDVDRRFEIRDSVLPLIVAERFDQLP